MNKTEQDKTLNKKTPARGKSLSIQINGISPLLTYKLIPRSLSVYEIGRSSDLSIHILLHLPGDNLQ